jgi:regulation of enolase protein 1 (concanavalin A-like superfamily)
MRQIPLDEGAWLNHPVSSTMSESGFTVVTADKSDFWRTTSYGFIHENGHALLNDFPQDTALEVSWLLDYHQQFDQAGLFVYAEDNNWIKAGIEFCDGAPQLGAVVTRDVSDWSVAPVPEWFGHEVHLRISRSGDALTIRARHDGDWKLVRLCPLDPSMSWRAGLFCASPSRAELKVTFTALRRGDADESLH